jgi:hypothetical protein
LESAIDTAATVGSAPTKTTGIGEATAELEREHVAVEGVGVGLGAEGR